MRRIVKGILYLCACPFMPCTMWARTLQLLKRARYVKKFAWGFLGALEGFDSFCQVQNRIVCNEDESFSWSWDLCQTLTVGQTAYSSHRIKRG
jgi:hypothetical protein